MSPSLQALAKAADERFPKLSGHGERTASYAVAAAHHLGILEARLKALRIAAALHYAWSDEGDCPCCEHAGNALSRWALGESPSAADFIRGMRADWNMAPLEASILAAACHYDLQRIDLEVPTTAYRPGISEALQAIIPVITPLDRRDV